MQIDTMAIRITCGSGEGPTEIASYDAALHEAGISNYNLVQVSSMIPREAGVEVVKKMPDLGPFGNRLWVVQAKTTVRGRNKKAVAGLAWARGGKAGIFYESSGGDDEENVRKELNQGIEYCKGLRDWEFGDTNMKINSSNISKSEFATSVVVGVYGKSKNMF